MINIKGRESREKSGVGWTFHTHYPMVPTLTAGLPRINKFRKGKHENRVLREKNMKCYEIKCYEVNNKVLRNKQQTCAGLRFRPGTNQTYCLLDKSDLLSFGPSLQTF